MEAGSNSYKIIYQGGTGEIVEKKSRFIATFLPIAGEEEALAFLAEQKKRYWDARHNCYAYVLGDQQQLQRCSDDGEPQGTAGRPMLEVLLKEGIHNAAVVVTRYFGGTLLGTGGLVRAYQGAMQAGLAASVVLELQRGIPLAIETDYNSIGRILYLLGNHGLVQQEAVYTDKVEVKTVVPEAECRRVLEEITEGTGGTAKCLTGDAVDFAVVDGQIKIFG
ncbi:MAG: YigZ family protein [Lachnospiraceae bacterium]|nr:YigZ family protein [Lachnospiraceae bacterium]